MRKYTWFSIGNQCFDHSQKKKLDMSTARRLKSPKSLSGTSTRPTMVTLVNIMAMNGWLKSFSFHVNRPSHSWDNGISDSDLETLRSRSWVRSKARSYSRPSVLLIRFLFISHQWHQQFLRYNYFEIWPWNIQGQGHECGKGHISYPVSSRCTSFLFHINWINHSWNMAKIVFELEKHIRNF